MTESFHTCHFLIRLLPPPDNHGLPSNPKHIYYLISSAISSGIWSFCTPTAIFCTKNCTILGALLSPRIGHSVCRDETILWIRISRKKFNSCEKVAFTGATVLALVSSLLLRALPEPARVICLEFDRHAQLW